MLKKRLWARVLGGVAVISLCLFGPSVASSADVQQLPELHKLGVAPFKGSPEEGCRLIVNDLHANLSYDDCMSGVKNKQDGKCTEAYLPDGFMITTFTRWLDSVAENGTPEPKPDHHASAVNYKPQDSFGSPIPEDGDERKALKCPTDNPKWEMWWPLVCDNPTARPKSEPVLAQKEPASQVGEVLYSYSSISQSFQDPVLPDLETKSSCASGPSVSLRSELSDYKPKPIQSNGWAIINP